MSSDCLFCRLVDGEIPSNKIFEDDEVLAFEDIHPLAPTHSLIIPKKHIATSNELGPQDDALVGKLVRTAARIAADKGLSESGYRTVMNCQAGGGQTVFHIHLHLLGGRPLGWPPG